METRVDQSCARGTLGALLGVGNLGKRSCTYMILDELCVP